MKHKYPSVYRQNEAQIGMQVARKFSGKKGSLYKINEQFSRKIYVQDAPNMSFVEKCAGGDYEA